jgi:hypothetical protein
MKNDLHFNDVDTLGNLLAQIADLTKQADKIKDEIKEGGKTVEGALFKATYVEANRKVTDWKAIAKAYNIPDEAIIDNTTVSAVYSIKVTAR